MRSNRPRTIGHRLRPAALAAILMSPCAPCAAQYTWDAQPIPGRPHGADRHRSWSRMYGGDYADHFGDAVVGNDFIILVGGSSSFSPGATLDAWIVRTDLEGEIVWQKSYGVSAVLGPSEDFRSVDLTDDGGIFVTGMNDRDVWLLRLGSAGEIMWQKRLADAHSPGSVDAGYCVSATADGGCIVGAETSPIPTANREWWIAKFGPFGTIEWQQMLAHEGVDELAAIEVVPAGGYVACGTTNQGAGSDVVVVRFDDTGNVIWQYRYGATQDDAGKAIAALENGGFVVAGHTNSYVDAQHDRNLCYVVRLDAWGGIVWQRIYGGVWNDEATSIAEMPNGELLVSGRSASWGELTAYSPWTLKLTASGDIRWQVEYEADTSVFDVVAAKAPKGFLVACKELGLLGDGASYDHWVNFAKPDGTVSFSETSNVRTVRTTAVPISVSYPRMNSTMVVQPTTVWPQDTTVTPQDTDANVTQLAP